MMRPLIVIPARGGSKGIPRKNIKTLAGKPLIAYTIDTAISIANAISLPQGNILVSTDDDEIAAVAQSCGVPVPYRRPAELATDKSGSREVIIDAMDWADRNNITYDCVLLLQPTSPLRSVEDVMRSLELFATSRPDMVVSVKEASSNPYYNCFETDPETGHLHISKGDGSLTRRQDAPKAWEFNGAVYVISTEAIRAMPLGAMPRRIPYVMPSARSIDLDTPLDWTVAEAIISHYNNETA